MSEPPGIPSDHTYYVVEQFVSEVLDFSFQYASISFTAHNIVGRPTKFPFYGDFSQTFLMRDYGPWTDRPSGNIWRTLYICPKIHQSRANKFIYIKFVHAVCPFHIHIYETYNPGGLVALYLEAAMGLLPLIYSWRTGYITTTKTVLSSNTSY